MFLQEPEIGSYLLLFCHKTYIQSLFQIYIVRISHGFRFLWRFPLPSFDAKLIVVSMLLLMSETVAFPTLKILASENTVSAFPSLLMIYVFVSIGKTLQFGLYVLSLLEDAIAHTENTCTCTSNYFAVVLSWAVSIVSVFY